MVNQEKDDWAEELADEESAHDRLKELQGKVTTILYGWGHLDGLPALILSKLHGMKLNELTRSNVCEPPAESLKAYLKVVGEFSKYKACIETKSWITFCYVAEATKRVQDL